jgi:short-subunit dehydrogenase
MQTPEQVVETSLKAVRRKKVVPVSGFTNYISSIVGSITPEWIVTRAISSVLRSRIEKNERQ